jgi:lipoyl(octanoyl) transferase
VYIKQTDGSAGAKIAALGLKISRGCSFHGMALNVAMDLEPFSRINPCGYPGLAVTDIDHELFGKSPTLHQAGLQFAELLRHDIESHR